MIAPTERSTPYKPKNRLVKRMRLLVKNLLRGTPWLWRPLSAAWHLQKTYTIQARADVAALVGRLRGYYGPGFDADRIIWVDPCEIVYCSLNEFPVAGFEGQVIGGNWDLLERKYDDLDISVAFRDIIQDGKPWSETVFYQRMLAALNQGHVVWESRTKQEFDQRCAYLEKLYHSIQEKGYKTRRELTFRIDGEEIRTEEKEIGVNIGRFGDLLFTDGAHRLAIAKALDLQRIPVQVAVRHAQWAEFRKRMLRYARARGMRRMQPVPHPDLSDIPYNKEYEALFEVILRDIPEQNARILDIGAGLGYFSSRFAELGRDCYALEDLPEECSLLQTLHHASSRSYKFLEGPLGKVLPAPDLAFDAVLVLDLLFQAQTRPERLAELSSCLDRLAFQRLYILSPVDGIPEPSADDITGPLADLIQQLHPRLVRALYHTKDGWTLYSLTC